MWLGRSRLGQALFTLFIERLFAFFKELYLNAKKRKEREEQNKRILEALKNAKTPEEIQNATNEIARSLFDE